MIRLVDCIECSNNLALEPEIIQAVANVESGKDINAFLFEPHVFSRLTYHKYDLSHPDVSYPAWDRTRYPKNVLARQDQFDKAEQLAGDLAYRSASWGLFQIMGYHYNVLGYKSAKLMATDLRSTVLPNINAFGEFIRMNGLIDNLRNQDWERFARGYNGQGYRLNKYDTRIAEEYKKLKNGNTTTKI